MGGAKQDRNKFQTLSLVSSQLLFFKIMSDRLLAFYDLNFATYFSLNQNNVSGLNSVRFILILTNLEAFHRPQL